MKYIRDVLNGVAMALANSVPGVSGGTIALLLGFYDEMIGAINDIFYHRGKRLRGLLFMLRLGSGWLVTMIAAILLIDAFFGKHIYAISSLFFGFVLCSIPMMIYDERRVMKGKYYNAVFTVIGAAFIGALTYFSTLETTVVDLNRLTFSSAVIVFFVGALALVAMLLPGISGSTIFLVFGLYENINSALHAVMTFDFSAIPSLCFLGLGAVAGGLGAIRGIKYCLDRFRSQTVYMVIGMLIGSLYSIMMGPLTLEVKQPPMYPNRINWIFFVIGILLMAGLEVLKLYRQKKSDITTQNTAE